METVSLEEVVIPTTIRLPAALLDRPPPDEVPVEAPEVTNWMKLGPAALNVAHEQFHKPPVEPKVKVADWVATGNRLTILSSTASVARVPAPVLASEARFPNPEPGVQVVATLYVAAPITSSFWFLIVNGV